MSTADRRGKKVSLGHRGPRKNARKYDHEKVIRDLEDHLANGGLLKTFCEATQNPNQSALYDMIRRSEEFEAAYMRALRHRAIWLADEVQALTIKVRDGEVNYNNGKVALNSMQWMVEKFWPKVFGQYRDVHDAMHDMKDMLQAARQRALAEDPAPAQIEAKQTTIIDVEAELVQQSKINGSPG